EGGRIPELKRVVVAYQNRVVMRETLEAGLATLFGGDVPRQSDSAVVAPVDSAAGPVAPPPAPSNADLIGEARSHYDRAIAAQRAGDWATYGREIQLLGETLGR